MQLRPVVLSLVLASVLTSACGSGDDAAPSQQNQPPHAVFISACTGLTCKFTESSRDPDGHVASWLWDFGDQKTSTEPNPTHVYESVNTFQVTLIVTDNDGTADTLTKSITTTPPTTTAISVTLDQQAGFKAVLTSSVTCEAHGNTFRITAPVTSTLTTDACYDQIGKAIVFTGPYPAGTTINMEILSPPLSGPPGVHIEGSYPQWTLRFEDGVDQDYNDVTITVTALP